MHVLILMEVCTELPAPGISQCPPLYIIKLLKLCADTKTSQSCRDSEPPENKGIPEKARAPGACCVINSGNKHVLRLRLTRSVWHRSQRNRRAGLAALKAKPQWSTIQRDARRFAAQQPHHKPPRVRGSRYAVPYTAYNTPGYGRVLWQQGLAAL